MAQASPTSRISLKALLCRVPQPNEQQEEANTLYLLPYHSYLEPGAGHVSLGYTGYCSSKKMRATVITSVTVGHL